MNVESLINITNKFVEKNQKYYESLFSFLYYNSEQYIPGKYLNKPFNPTDLIQGTKTEKKSHRSGNEESPRSIIKYMTYIFNDTFFKDQNGCFFKILWASIDKRVYNYKTYQNMFYKNLLSDFDKLNLYNKYSYKSLKIKKTYIRNLLINTYETNTQDVIIQLISDYKEINIIIIKNNIPCFFCPLPGRTDGIKPGFNIFRPTIILEKLGNNDNYQPIYQRPLKSKDNAEPRVLNKKIFTSNDVIQFKLLKYLNLQEIKTHPKTHPKERTDKEIKARLCRADDRQGPRPLALITEEYKIQDNTHLIQRMTSKDNELPDITDLLKKKLVELQNISKSLNIDVQKLTKNGKNKKNKKKSELIDEILRVGTQCLPTKKQVLRK